MTWCSSEGVTDPSPVIGVHLVTDANGEGSQGSMTGRFALEEEH